MVIWPDLVEILATSCANVLPLTGKRTLTSFRETGFSHSYLPGCSRLVKLSERVAIHNQTGCQKSLMRG